MFIFQADLVVVHAQPSFDTYEIAPFHNQTEYKDFSLLNAD